MNASNNIMNASNNIIPTDKINKTESLQDIMKDLEKKVNPKSVNEGLVSLSHAIKTKDVSSLMQPMIDGSKEFEARVGRPMTYGEMRAMWG